MLVHMQCNMYIIFCLNIFKIRRVLKDCMNFEWVEVFLSIKSIYKDDERKKQSNTPNLDPMTSNTFLVFIVFCVWKPLLEKAITPK